MSKLSDGLREVMQNAQSADTLPTIDGKYVLPDRRLLIKEGDRYLVIGHRDKRQVRRYTRCTQAELLNLLVLPGFGSKKRDAFKNANVDDLVRELVPRPKQTFVHSWLQYSGSPEAYQMRELARKAEKVNE